MSERGRWARFGWMMSGALIAVVAYEAGRARAAVPATDPLVYSGYLTDTEGAAVAASAVSLTLDFQNKDGTSLCSYEPPSKIPVETGRFSIVLTKCTEEIRKAGDVWIQLTVDGKQMTERSKIAAVPFALEAANATNLDPAAKQALKSELKSPKEAYPDCPPGYERPMTADNPPKPVEADFIVCQRENDVVVRVGSGAAEFWIDRHEATGWSEEGGKGTQYFKAEGDYPDKYPRSASLSGSSAYSAIYAASVSGVYPAGWATWFMAAAACRTSGKRLPTSEEWLAAARDTLKPFNSDGADGNCNIAGASSRHTGVATAGYYQGNGGCVSRWGVEDMIGNQWEWTLEWQTGLTGDATPDTPWPPGEGYDNDQDVTYNVAGPVSNGIAALTKGMPAAVSRGGSFGSGQKAGVFTMALDGGPSYSHAAVGFRCVIPR